MDEKGYQEIIAALLNLLDEGVYIVDDTGKGIFYNEAMAAIEQVNVDDVLGKPYHKAFPGVRLGESTLFQALNKGVSTRNKQQTYLNLYGREVTTVNSTVPVRTEGKTVAAIEVARDLTHIRSLSDEIQELREEKIQLETAEPKIRRYTFDDLVGSEPRFLQVIDRAKSAAKNSASVFIYGETGTGKELFAQSIHYASARRNKPFLAQNCAALPESLLEGILFGTAKGGFTGAVDRAGLFEQASGGTLLLDEVSAMPIELQGKLLRVLQEMYIRRVGGTRDIPIDTRIIATVNEPADKLIEEGRLRKDLYYRLNVVGIVIPPLRDRLSDIKDLTETFIARYNETFGKDVRSVSDKALDILRDYNYPGNVRELENIIAQAVSMADSEHVLGPRLLHMPMRTEMMGSDIERWDRRGPLQDYLENLEKEIIRETLMEERGNITKAAEALSLRRQTLQHKLKKYGLREE